MKSFYTKNKNQGFTLLFAALVVTILMSIGFSMSNITLSQLILSSSGRESQFAFYNADSGLECALYYEYNGTSTTGGPIFPRNSSDIVPDAFTVGNDIKSSISCDGYSPSKVDVVSDVSSATTTFYINIDPSNSTYVCNKAKPSFSVSISKTLPPAGAPSGSNSVYIQSRGYNTCDPTSPKRVERGIYARFVD